MRRPQNTKAAAQRLAQVMSHQSADEDEDEDDLLYDYRPAIPSAGIGLAGGRTTRGHSPLPARASVETLPTRPASGARTRGTLNYAERQPSSVRSALWGRPAPSKPTEQPPSLHSSVSQTSEADEEVQPSSAHSNAARRSSPSFNQVEQPSSARSMSAGRPNLGGKSPNMVAANVPLPLRSAGSAPLAEVQPNKIKDKRLSFDLGTFKYREPTDQQFSSDIQDEVDMLQEENEGLREKLRIAEERCDEAESRTRQLEKEIAATGEGVSSDCRLLSSKEADLQRREAALKVAEQIYGGTGEEISALTMEAEHARDEATSALEQLHDIESEVKSLRKMTRKMILTEELMEEVVLKRSWLARYWSYCVRHGIHADIAGARYEYWSSLSPTPVEAILAAGQKAKENSPFNDDARERESCTNSNEISRDANVESMVLVERGLRELTALKVEWSVAMVMAQHRRPSSVRSSLQDELKLPIEGQNFLEGFELSQEESEDVRLKQAWLIYFWRRAKDYGLEPDTAEKRLKFFIDQGNRSATSQDAVDVERGLMELRKLEIETKLWRECRMHQYH